MEKDLEEKWYENDIDNEEDSGYVFKEYDVTATPNDFNTKTIIDFIESGLFKIPGFQRNYVWDIKRASKFIESIIIGLPIPQVFLYEENKNNYLVIDGQQRLLTIYFFSKKRFPKQEKRFLLRQVFEDKGTFPDEYLHSDDFFEDFKLKMEDKFENKLHGLNYSTLADLKSSFDLRTIRNIMVRQNLPTNDDSAMFEIFNRLNSGGIVLKAQEIRTSLYHSKFYKCLYKINMLPNWRKLLNKVEPDTHMKDIEVILRGFAMLLNSKNYSPSMTRFLNEFSKQSKNFSEESLDFFQKLFEKFCESLILLGPNTLISKAGKFSITLFESIFVALCSDIVKNKNLEDIVVTTKAKIDKLKSDENFFKVSQEGTARKANVDARLKIAKEILIS